MIINSLQSLHNSNTFSGRESGCQKPVSVEINVYIFIRNKNNDWVNKISAPNQMSLFGCHSNCLQDPKTKLKINSAICCILFHIFLAQNCRCPIKPGESACLILFGEFVKSLVVMRQYGIFNDFHDIYLRFVFLNEPTLSMHNNRGVLFFGPIYFHKDFDIWYDSKSQTLNVCIYFIVR